MTSGRQMVDTRTRGPTTNGIDRLLANALTSRSPRPSLTVFHTGSDEILAVGMAWERGYMAAVTWLVELTEGPDTRIWSSSHCWSE